MIVLIVYIVIVFIMLFTLMYLKRLRGKDSVDDEVDMIGMSILWPLVIPGFLVILFWEMVVKVFNRIIDAIEEARKKKNDRKRDL